MRWGSLTTLPSPTRLIESCKPTAPRQLWPRSLPRSGEGLCCRSRRVRVTALPFPQVK